jgi:aryl-alcohol dehydrogenase-like predicted oxidoreductase
MMEKRILGNSDLSITRLGFGAWAIGGGGWTYGWGPQDDAASVGAIRRALDLGVNWIDTAAVYGFGHSEEIVAKALEGVSPRPYVFTKCGLVDDGTRNPKRNLRPESIRAEAEASLKRLRVDAIDLYQIHWPHKGFLEAWETMAALRKEGKVRWIGVSNFDVPRLEEIVRIAPVTSLQPPYSLVNPQAEKAELPWCQKEGIGVIVYSPMYSGLLSGAMTEARVVSFPSDDWRSRDPEFQPPRIGRHLRLVELLRTIASDHGCSPGEVAISWTLRRPEVTGAIVGARSAAQVDGWIGAAGLRLTDDDLRRIDAFCTAHPSEARPLA